MDTGDTGSTLDTNVKCQELTQFAICQACCPTSCDPCEPDDEPAPETETETDDAPPEPDAYDE